MVRRRLTNREFLHHLPCLFSAGKIDGFVSEWQANLDSSDDTGTKLINRALDDTSSELRRQELNIMPVDLAANAIYDILRKRFFNALPGKAMIGELAEGCCFTCLE